MENTVMNMARTIQKCAKLGKTQNVGTLLYFLDHKAHRTIRRTLIFLFDFLEKNDDECVLILVIYWKKTGLLHNKISNHNLIYSS